MEKRYERTLDAETRAAEKAEGVKLSDIKIGQKLKITTQNTEYILEHREDGFYLSGNKDYCPTPRKTQINGSTWGGHAIMSGGFIGVGMQMEIGSIEGTDIAGDVITTSIIKSIEKIEN
ncbi:MAG: hypothetical protein Q8R55_01865 [Candidatus Taylorbacteria bacterium]|nr:hypothetical protein [Candidatus Taylorbacteria bacterium]